MSRDGDIDYFKQINDMHGHKTGDAVLEAIASTLVRSFPRRSDVIVTACVGVAEALPFESADSWFARADLALYAAKTEGRDLVAVAGGEPAERSELAS